MANPRQQQPVRRQANGVLDRPRLPGLRTARAWQTPRRHGGTGRWRVRVAGDHRLQDRAPVVRAVDVARPQEAALQVAELIEEEQRVVARTAEVAVVGGALLSAVGRALGAVQVQDDAVRGLRSCIRSIQAPERSARAARFASLAGHSVSKRPIWLIDAAGRLIPSRPTIGRIAASRASGSASLTSS
jgi:hypothetical protein